MPLSALHCGDGSVNLGVLTLGWCFQYRWPVLRIRQRRKGNISFISPICVHYPRKGSSMPDHGDNVVVSITLGLSDGEGA